MYYITSSAYSFVSALDTLGLPVLGQQSTYGGGGYVAEFNVNRNISMTMATELYQHTWIDRRTRAVFVEFTLYSVDENVFTYFSFLTEFPETGGVINTPSVTPFRPYQHIGGYGIFILVCEVITVIGMIVFTINNGIYVYRNGKKSFKEIWNVLDIVIIILFFLSVIMYIGQCLMIKDALEKFHENNQKFVNFSHIVLWNEMLNISLAFVIFLTTFRLMKVLSYNARINQLGVVLSHVIRDLLGCFVMFLIVYSAFVSFGYLIFGRYLETYKNLFISSTTLVNAVIGKNSINDLFSVEPVLGRMYYFFFVLFLLWILMTMMNATLNCGITTVRAQPIPKTYGITNLMSDLWTDMVAMIVSPKTEKQSYYEINKQVGMIASIPPEKQSYHDTNKQVTCAMEQKQNNHNVNKKTKKKQKSKRIYQ